MEYNGDGRPAVGAYGGFVVDEDLAQLATVAGWTVDGRVAVFHPDPGGWRATVRVTREAGRHYDRLHIAVVDPANRAQFTTWASSVGEAQRVAEAQVRARNAAT